MRYVPTKFEHFIVQPTEVVTFIKDPYWDLEICDSVYAILTDPQCDEVLELCKQCGCGPEDDEYSVYSRFKIDEDEGNFIMISESPESGISGIFVDYCEGHGIEFQTHIDTPIMKKVDREIDWANEESWGEVAYTGNCSGYDHPRLLETLYHLQH